MEHYDVVVIGAGHAGIEAANISDKYGFKNNFNIYFKNLNTVGKNNAKYKSSVQSEILNIYEINTKFPLIKEMNKNINYLTPKLSFRINPEP